MTIKDWIAISSYILGCFCIASFVYGWSNDLTSRSAKYAVIQLFSAIGFVFALVVFSYVVLVK